MLKNNQRCRGQARLSAALLVAGFVLVMVGAAGAEGVITPYQPVRYDDDFTYLRDPAKSDDFWDPIKYIPLDGPDTYVTFGGELRERIDHFSEPEFGLTRQRDSLDDVLQRLLLNADLRLGPRVRVFLQLGDYIAAGKSDLTGPADVDRLDLQQGFADATLSLGPGTLTVRIGRQEMAFGSQRLVSLREPLNVRRSFDGVRAFYEAGTTRIDAFLTKPVKNKAGIFDDEPDPQQSFWGVHATTPVRSVPGLHADLYYLGFEHLRAPFAEATADETRHIVGIRLWGAAHGWDYDTELTGQTGRFGDQTILAWAISSNTGYTFTSAPLTPRLGLKANVASGNRNPGRGTFGTFNPLFPAFGYFTEAELIIEANLIDIYPSLTIHPAPGMTLSVGADVLWRESVQDGLYGAPFIPVIRSGSGEMTLLPLTGGAGSTSRYIGTEVQLALDWQVSRHINAAAAYVHFAAGPTITAAGGKSVDFVGTRIGYQF